jgi:hypothetical protein
MGFVPVLIADDAVKEAIQPQLDKLPQVEVMPLIGIPAYIMMGVAALCLILVLWRLVTLRAFRAVFTLLAAAVISYYPVAYGFHYWWFKYHTPEMETRQVQRWEQQVKDNWTTVDYGIMAACGFFGLLLLSMTLQGRESIEMPPSPAQPGYRPGPCPQLPYPQYNDPYPNNAAGATCSTLAVIFGSLAFCLCPYVFGVIGLVLGIIGTVLSRHKGTGIFGLVLSVAGIVIGPFVAVAFWLAVLLGLSKDAEKARPESPRPRMTVPLPEFLMTTDVRGDMDLTALLNACVSITLHNVRETNNHQALRSFSSSARSLATFWAVSGLRVQSCLNRRPFRLSFSTQSSRSRSWLP